MTNLKPPNNRRGYLFRYNQSIKEGFHMGTKKILKAIILTSEIIKDITYLFEVRLRSTYFRKEGKMGFVNLISFILSHRKRSLQIELDNFFKSLPGENCSITKQAFSEARQKISPKAFIILFQAVIKQFYEDDFKTFRGFRLSAIDGTTLELPNTETLRKAYGYAENTTSKVARAKVSGLYDVENNFMIDAIIDHYKVDERSLAYRHIKTLQELGLKNDLILFDRGYGSKKIIAELIATNINFVMRVSSHFIKAINLVKNNDEIVEYCYKQQKYRVRVLKFMLKSGQEEILVTSLLDLNFTLEDFKELYFKRWKIETKYYELKHKLEIENFTGETPIAIEQDFYASMYITNLVALAKMDADKQIQAENQTKQLKYEYQTNTNILIGKLKDQFVLMMLVRSGRKRIKILKNIMNEIVRNTVPIRPNRTNPRVKRIARDRYPMNQRKGS